MKRVIWILLVSLIVILSCTFAYATTQESEIVYYEGKAYRLYNANPLGSFYKNSDEAPKFRIGPNITLSTGNYRGYVGTWEIKDDMLFLVDIDGWVERDTGYVKATPKILFSDRCIDGRVAATWFTGELRLQGGDIIERGIGNLHEREVVIQLESGKITGKELIDNTKNADERARIAELFEAIRGGNLAEVQALLNEGVDPDVKDSVFHYTALMCATQNVQLEIAKGLIDKGADVNAKTDSGLTALMSRVRVQRKSSDYIKIAELLLENGADVNAKEVGGSTPLLLQSIGGDVEVIRLFLEKGADVNAKTDDGTTALMCASKTGEAEIVRFLLENGADANAVDNDGNTALILAGHAEIVDLLKKAGATGELDRDKRMIIAVQDNNLEDAKALIDQGADVNSKINDFGETLLINASSNNYANMARLLLDNGADMEITLADGMTALIRASSRGHTEVIKVLLDGGADINAVFMTPENETALAAAASKGHLEAVRLLLNKGADVNAKSIISTRSVLQLASMNGHADVVRLLLERGAGSDSSDLNIALKVAAMDGYADVVRLLLDAGADANAMIGTSTALDAAKKKGLTEMVQTLEKSSSENPVDPSKLLIEAAENGNLADVQALLDKGTDVSARENGMTALMSASLWGHADVVRLLLEKGADVNAKRTTSGDTALMCASMGRSKDVVKILLDKGADVNEKNVNGRTALINAAGNGSAEVVKLLIENGADVDAKDNGQSALYRAARQGYKEVVRLLLENGADANIKTNNSETPLMRAIASRNSRAREIKGGADTNSPWTQNITRIITEYTEIIKYLLDNGADVNAKNSDGETALMMATACEADYADVVRLLLEKKADVNAKAVNGETAIFRASQYGHPEIVRLLLDNGADANTKTENGGTPLKMARDQYYTEIVQMLEKAGARE